SKQFERPDLEPRRINQTVSKPKFFELSSSLQRQLDERFALDRELLRWVEARANKQFSAI
ncbi:MAG: hypothetical protein KBT70_01880, partial [Roseovarius sp.]|uniref:hypothetical protein n=1 Tax=Roseovarius sp. TaxID=1486281 RepID=UPI001B656084